MLVYLLFLNLISIIHICLCIIFIIKYNIRKKDKIIINESDIEENKPLIKNFKLNIKKQYI